MTAPPADAAEPAYLLFTVERTVVIDRKPVADNTPVADLRAGMLVIDLARSPEVQRHSATVALARGRSQAVAVALGTRRVWLRSAGCASVTDCPILVTGDLRTAEGSVATASFRGFDEPQWLGRSMGAKLQFFDTVTVKPAGAAAQPPSGAAVGQDLPAGELDAKESVWVMERKGLE